MKFKDIKKFPKAGYQVDLEWLGLDEIFKSYQNDYGLELDPVYQRGYVWTEYQQTAYIEYRLRGGMGGRDVYMNSFNWQGGGEVGVLQLVDGKQRIEAVMAFLQNRLPIFNGNYFKDFTDNIRIFEGSFKLKINNLPNEREVIDWYLALNTGGSHHTEEDLKPAYEYRDLLINNKNKS